MDHVYEKFSDRLTSLNLIWLDPAAFSHAVHSQGAALSNCWGFIDGTVRPISRPSKNQRIMFSGHKRVHCIKFQVCYCITNLLLLLICIIIVSGHSKWTHRSSFRPYWRTKTWRFHAFRKWTDSETLSIHTSKRATICCLWRPSVRCNSKHHSAISWSPSNISRACF